MRFRKDGVGKITPILVAASDKNGPYVWPKGQYKHIQAEGRPETMMWSTRPHQNSGRGFGFTGGHKHQNWGNDNYRKAVLNEALWIAKAKVPKNSDTVHRHRRGAEAKPRYKVTILTFADFCLIDSLAYGI